MIKFNKAVAVFIGFYFLCHISANAQFFQEVNVFQFKNGSREDSLRTATERVTYLLKCREFFEKTYLRKKLVLAPLPVQYDSLFIEKSYMFLSETSTLKKSDRKYLKSYYNEINRKLNQTIKNENIQFREENKKILKIREESPQTQMGTIRLSKREDYEIIFCATKIIIQVEHDGTAIEPENDDPRRIVANDSISRSMEQILLGRPNDIDGFVNSINYTSIDFSNVKFPLFITVLLEENLKLWKKIIANVEYQNKINNVTISYSNLSGDNKLWVYNSLPAKQIYLSPYLIRAVFNISLYQNKIFRLAEEVNQNEDDIIVYFSGKSGASVKQIDSAYFTNFVNKFSSSIFFVIGHELAHLYLPSSVSEHDIEVACDTYAAFFMLQYFKELQLGIFETLLIKSIASNELEFWGKTLDSKSLTERYQNLKRILETRDISQSIFKMSTY